tara:strand:+ start:822 stop:1271 length:450 start_codon:yes stop_codon:yes gene_type:complete
MKKGIITIYLIMAIVAVLAIIFIFVTVDRTTDLKTGQAYATIAKNAKEFAQIKDYFNTCLSERFQALEKQLPEGIDPRTLELDFAVALQREFEKCIDPDLFEDTGIVITQKAPVAAQVSITPGLARIKTSITLQQGSYQSVLEDFVYER